MAHRTTITLDSDVEELVQRRMRERGATFKAIVNEGLRESLAPNPKQRRPYNVPTFSMGPMAPAIFDHALQLAGELEDREVLAKLRLGK
jgi:hypothetical protein